MLQVHRYVAPPRDEILYQFQTYESLDIINQYQNYAERSNNELVINILQILISPIDT